MSVGLRLYLLCWVGSGRSFIRTSCKVAHIQGMIENGGECNLGFLYSKNASHHEDNGGKAKALCQRECGALV